jgi:protein-S-isoprenylcysteine O-methyltransferase Ste14
MRALELKVPPLAVAALAALVMLLAARIVPALQAAIPARPAFAGFFAVAGVLINLAGVVEFRRAGTTLNPTRPEATSAMVSGGVYRLTRNPMYLGFLLALLGWATWLGNLLALAVVAGFVLYLTRFQIVPEERLLAQRFGGEFAAYRQRVRRWL